MKLNAGRSPLPSLIVTALVGGASVLGCSLFTVVPPPRPAPPPGEPVDCTRSRAAPWADTVLAPTALVGSVAASTLDCQGSGCDVKAMITIPTLLLAVGYTFSALYGHARVGQCRSLLDQRETSR